MEYGLRVFHFHDGEFPFTLLMEIVDVFDWHFNSSISKIMWDKSYFGPKKLESI